MKNSNFKYFFLNSVNFLYLICGLSLVIGSITVLTDTDRVLISRLIPVESREPILYYVCLTVLFLGLLVSILSTVGCWAIYTENNCLLTTYVFGVVVLLLSESVAGILTAVGPEYLGLQLDRDVLDQVWQSSYGVPGKEQYTVAIDLIQVQFECCGVNSGNDYSTSWWYLKELAAPNLTVPISCCFLDRKLTKSYLDPVPINLSACQDIFIERFHNARHHEGCYLVLENWLRDQKIQILFAAIVNLAVQLLILFAVISSCISNKHSTLDANESTPHSYVTHVSRGKY